MLSKKWLKLKDYGLSICKLMVKISGLVTNHYPMLWIIRNILCHPIVILEKISYTEGLMIDNYLKNGKKNWKFFKEQTGKIGRKMNHKTKRNNKRHTELYDKKKIYLILTFLTINKTKNTRPDYLFKLIHDFMFNSK